MNDDAREARQIDVVRTAIVVLNWNGRTDTIRCLTSLSECLARPQIVLVDNGSADGTVNEVRHLFPDVTIIENSENEGFSAANNRGIAWALDAGCTVVGVLNNDTVVDENFLVPLLAAIEARSESVYVSPLIRYLSDPTKVWFGGAEIEPETNIFVHRSIHQFDAGHLVPTPMITGCALFAHRSVWQRVGLFDERYFLSFEDAEWSARANSMGCRGLVVNDSCIFHAVSSTVRSRAVPAAHYYYARNGLLFLRVYARRRWRDPIRFVERRARDSMRQFRSDRKMKNLAVPTLQARGILDAVRGRSGPFIPGRLTRWAVRAHASPLDVYQDA